MNMQNKRNKVLEVIKPICEAFNITNYDYTIEETSQRETLRIGETKIACSGNSIDGVIDELIGCIFINI